MERKLVKQGNNAMTVTLPAKWIKDHHLTSHDVVYLYPHKNEITIRTTNKSSYTVIEIDLKQTEQKYMYHIIAAKYIEGYDEIHLLNTPSEHIQKFQTFFTGMIITQQNQKRIVFKNIIKSPDEDVHIIIRRCGHILTELSREYTKETELLLDQHILYCLRYLHKYEHTANTYWYFLLCTTLEYAGDQLKRIAEQKPSKQTQKALQELIETYIQSIFKSDTKKAYQITRTFKEQLKKKTFLDGLLYELVENLYNYIGFIVKEKS